MKLHGTLLSMVSSQMTRGKQALICPCMHVVHRVKVSELCFQAALNLNRGWGVYIRYMSKSNLKARIFDADCDLDS